MVIKKKKVETSLLMPKPYLNHSSKGVNDEALKTMMCKDIKDRFNIQKGIDKIDKSLKTANTSIYKTKTSVRGLVKEFGSALENNYYNFNKASVENPFSKYGVLLDEYKLKPRRKTNSAPSFLEFDDELMQKIDTTLEEDKITRDTTGDADENADKFPFPIEETESRGMVSTDYYNSSNLRNDLSLNELNDTYRNNLSLETTRSYKTDYISLGKETKSDYIDTSREYKGDFAGAGPYKTECLDTSRTYKSDSPAAVKSQEFETRRIVYNPVDEMVRRLYKCTKNVFFDRSHTHNSIKDKLEENAIPTESTASNAILNYNPADLCNELMERLETLVASRPKRSTSYYSKYKYSSYDPLSNLDIFSRTLGSNLFLRNPNSGNSHSGDGSSKYSLNYYSSSHASTDYEETTLDVTPNKYTGSNEYEDALLKVSTESAKRAISKVRSTRKPLKPYNPNDDFMLTDSEDYAYIDTKLGRIIYSPKLHDDKYMYRFVVLTSEAQKAVEILCKNTPKNFSLGLSSCGKRLLTEYEIIKELGIRMSSGWHHFFYFKNANKELILRKRL